MHQTPLVLAVSIATLLAPAAGIHAQTASGWTGAVDSLWSTPGNWDNGEPMTAGTVVDLFFGLGYVAAGGTGSLVSNNNLVGYNGSRITFERTALATDPAFIITGNAFSLFDFGTLFPRIQNLSNVAQSFNLSGAITLDGGSLGKAEINPVAGDLTFSATTPIVLNSPLDILGNTGKTVTFNGIVSGGAANPITLKENSTVVLAAANTYAGATNIQGGVVSIAASSNLGNASATNSLSLSGGGALRATSAAGINLGVNRTIALGTGGGTIDTAGVGTLTVPGVVSGGALTKTGASTLTLGGGAADASANTFSGTTTVSLGTLLLDKAAGTNAIAGDVTVAGGNLNRTRNEQIADSASVTLSDGFLGLTTNELFTETVQNLTIAGGTWNTGGTGGGGSVATNGKWNVNGTLSVSGGAVAQNSGSLVTANTVALSGTPVWNMTGNNTIAPTLLNVGPGGLTLSGQTITLNSGAVVGALGSAIVLSGNVTNTAGTSTLAVANVNGTRFDLDLNGGSRTFDVLAGTLVNNARVVGTGNILKTGAGILALGRANTFTGNVVINGGSVALRAANAVPNFASANAAAVQVNTGGTLLFDTLLGDTTQFNNILGTGGGITSSGGTVRFDFGATNQERTFTNRTITVGTDGLTLDTRGVFSAFIEGAYSQIRFVGASIAGTGTVTKIGGGRAQFQTANPNFSGAIVVSDGTLEVNASALGNNSATNTVTLTGGNLAVSGGPVMHNLTLAGGSVSPNGSSQTLAGTVALSTGTSSNLFLNDFYRDAGPSVGLTLSNVVSGSGNLLVGVNRSSFDFNSGAVILQNTANTLSGTVTVGKNLNLTAQSSTGTGNTLGTATIDLATGKLNLRDNATGSFGTVAFGNNVTVSTPGAGTLATNGDFAGIATITADRASNSNTGNTIQLGSLAIGAQQLDFTGSNNYRVEFSGGAALSGAAIFNVTAGTLTLNGVTGGQSFTKTGAGLLRVTGTQGYTGYTFTAGGLEIATEPVGTGRTIALPAGSTFSAGYVATQANLIDRITIDSAGVVGIGADTAFNPDFTAFTNGLRLGGTANATLTGTITAAGSSYLLGGGGGTLTFASQDALSGVKTLDVNGNGTIPGVIVLGNTNSYTGATTVGGGNVLGITSLASISAAQLTLANGTLRLVGNADFSGLSSRTIAIGAGGATVDTNGSSISLPGYTGALADSFTKTGAGTLTLTNAANPFAGRTTVAGGILAIAGDLALGTVPATAVANQLQFNGGTLQANGTFAIPATRQITLLGAGSFDVTGANTLTVASTVAGGGVFTKEGPGTLLITVDPNNNGGFVVNGGVLALQHSGTTDGSAVINNGGTLRVLTANDLGDGTNVTVNSGGTFDLRANDQISQLLGTGLVTNGSGVATTLTLNTAANHSFGGIIQNGAATLGFTKNGGNIVTLTGANTYTGATTINTTLLAVSGPDGAIRGSLAVNVGDNNGGGEALTLGAVGDVVVGPLNRLADAGNITLSGTTTGGLTYNGPATGSGGNVETFGTLSFSSARNIVTLNEGTGNEVQLTVGTLVRVGGSQGVGLVRANNLGGTGVGSARLVFGALPTVGGGGADGSFSKSIVPFLIGDNSSNGIGTGFLTHNATTGLRLLTASEYDSTIAGPGTQRNVTLAGGEVVSSDVAINSLRVTGGITTIGSGADVTVGSGAILFTGAGTIAGGGRLDFGLNDAIINVASNTGAAGIVSTKLTGVGGISIGSTGTGANVVELGGNNDFSGTVVVNAGTLRLGSAGALNASIPAALTLRVGAGFQVNGNSVTIRNLQVTPGILGISNGAATDATLTTFFNSGQALNTLISNGGTGAFSLIVSGGQTISTDADASATGSFEQRLGTFVLTGGNGTLNDFMSYGINGGTLRLTNANTGTNGNRLRDLSPVTFNGGTLDFDNNASDASFTETAGAATFVSSASTITVDRATTVNSRTSALTLASLARNPGATVNFSSQSSGTAVFDLGIQTLATAQIQSRLAIAAAPVLDDGIIGGWATTESSATTREFATYVADADVFTAGNQPSVRSLAGATATLVSGASPTVNYRPTASPAALTGPTQVNSLTLAQASATTLDLGTSNLRLESGGLIIGGNFNAAVNNGTLTAGTGDNTASELFLHAANGNIANTAITFSNAADTLTKSGVLNGAPIVFTTAPAGLLAGVTYYAVNATATTFQVSSELGGVFRPITADGATAAFNETTVATVGAAIADNGTGVVSFTKAGNGLLNLSGAASTYTGTTYLNGGTVRITADNNLGFAPLTPTPGKLVLSNDAVLEVASTMTLDANRGITVGAGNNVVSILSGVGATGRVLAYNGSITSLGNTEGSLRFRSNTSGAGGVVVNNDPGELNATLAGGVNINGSLTLDAGSMTLANASSSIGRSLGVGTDGVGSLTYTGAANSLTIGKGINDTITIGGGTGDNVNNTGTLNLSGLGQFTANVEFLRLGFGTPTRFATGVATLATNNDITANSGFFVGISDAVGNNSVTSTLTFGSGANNVKTRALTVGGNKSIGLASIAAGGTLNLVGFGENTADLLVGSYQSTGVATGIGSPSNLDLTGGTLNASLNRLAVGEKTAGNGGGVFGTFTLTGTANVISANSVTIGNVNGNNVAGTTPTGGTMNFGGGSLSVIGDVGIGLLVNNTVGTPTAAGTVNITGGTVTVGGNITTTNSASASSTVNLDGGLLDLTGGTLNVDSFLARSGTLQNVVQIQSGDGVTAAALNKTTAGTLTIAGTNTYTGVTNVTAGAVFVTGSISGVVNVSNVGSVLGGVGTILGATTLAAGTTLAPGVGGAATLSTGSLTLNGGTFALDLVSSSLSDRVNVTGGVTLNAPIALTLAFTSTFAEGTPFTLIANDGTDAIVRNTGGFTYEGNTITPGEDFLATSGAFAQTFQLSYAGGTNSNDLVLTAVPEPGSALMLLNGFAALAGLKRFRRRNG